MNALRIKDIGEFGLIARIEQILGNRFSEQVLVGLGDDTATVQAQPQPLIVTTDMMVEGIHFRRDWSTAGQVAHKALASNLSDLAAKCARPAFYVVTIGLPPELEVRWVEDFYRTLAQLNREWGVEAVGGDTVRAETVLVSISAWGYQTTPAPIRIGNARVGDKIFVTGCLGDAAAALELLLNHAGELQESDRRYLLSRLHRPTPRLQEAREIARLVTPSAMTDISDGLARDLPKLCRAAQAGARVEIDRLPVSAALQRYAGAEAGRFAWKGGEDYELLLTVPAEQAETLIRRWHDSTGRITEIGEMRPLADGIQATGLTGDPVSGFDHFRSDD